MIISHGSDSLATRGCSSLLLLLLSLTAEFAHYFLISRTISQSEFAPNANPTTATEEGLDKPPPTGKYQGVADRFGLGLSFNF